MLATRLRWVSITPLDRPVVPDEYGSTTTSSRSTGHLLGERLAEQRRERADAGALGASPRTKISLTAVPSIAVVRRLEEHRDGDEPGRAGVVELVVHLAVGVGRVDVVTMPPAMATPWNTTAYSGQFGAMIASTSPLPKPGGERARRRGGGWRRRARRRSSCGRDGPSMNAGLSASSAPAAARTA